jgi:hypothetical protein
MSHQEAHQAEGKGGLLGRGLGARDPVWAETRRPPPKCRVVARRRARTYTHCTEASTAWCAIDALAMVPRACAHTRLNKVQIKRAVCISTGCQCTCGRRREGGARVPPLPGASFGRRRSFTREQLLQLSCESRLASLTRGEWSPHRRHLCAFTQRGKRQR